MYYLQTNQSIEFFFTQEEAELEFSNMYNDRISAGWEYSEKIGNVEATFINGQRMKVSALKKNILLFL